MHRSHLLHHPEELVEVRRVGQLEGQVVATVITNGGLEVACLPVDDGVASCFPHDIAHCLPDRQRGHRGNAKRHPPLTYGKW